MDILLIQMKSLAFSGLYYRQVLVSFMA